MTDRELLAEYARTGAQGAFTAIVERHAAKVYSTCLRVLGDPAAAEDAAQATFVVLARRGRKLSPRVLLSGWLYLTARNCARHAQLAEARRARHEREAAEMRERIETGKLSWEGVRPRLDAALEALPRSQRDALVLCYLDGRSRAEAAAELGCPPKTLDTRLTRGLARLRRKLGGGPSAAALGALLAENAVAPLPAGFLAAAKSAGAGGAALSASTISLAEGVMKAMTWTKIKIVACVACAVTAAGGGGTLAVREIAAGETSRLTPNKWTPLSEAGPAAVHARIVWLPGRKRVLVWPNYHSRAGKGNKEKTARLHLFDPAAGKWSAKPSSFPAGGEVRPEAVTSSCVYLPGLKRVLLLSSHWGNYSRKVKANAWLLDPAAGRWQGTAVGLRMTDSSKDFNPSPGMDGYPVPAWGALCYDAHNGEALLAGGGGVWGRVGKLKEKVAPGDWVYDEKAKRVRRLLAAEEGKVTEARRWFPGHCGSWTFSEKTGKWTALAQPLSAQPSGRILPGMAYDPAEKKIVLFGGDDLARCLADTWVYDCGTRAWSRAKPKGAPPARAAQAMLYVPGSKIILMAGGYGTGWKPLTDTWVYETAKKQWTRLGMELPTGAHYCSAAYVPEMKAVLLRLTRVKRGRPKTNPLCALRLELGSAPRAAAAAGKELKCHCLGKDWRHPSPEEWESAANRGGDPAARRKALAALPANAWVMQKTPLETASRTWGSYAYDVRTHKGYAWGGGHGGYQGADVTEYDLLKNRWTGMVDPPDFKHPWRHKNSGDSPPGLTYRGCILIQSHARKSYNVDPLTNSIVTSHGDVYSIAERRFVSSIGRCPGKWGLGDQAGYVTAPHGLYAFTSRGGGMLHRANVAAGRWDLVAKGGFKSHSEHNPMAYDSGRDRIFYLNYKDAAVWSFDFKQKKWQEEKPAGKAPAIIGGDPAYVPELDAMMFVIGTDRRGRKLANHFYKVAERKWYTAPYKGDASDPSRSGNGRLCNSTFWDPKLKVAVRIAGHYRQAQVLVMRPDFKALKLTPVE